MKGQLKEYIKDLKDRIDQSKRFSKRKIDWEPGALDRLEGRIQALTKVKQELQKIVKPKTKNKCQPKKN